MGLDETVGEHGVEVLADRGGAEAEPVAELRDGGRAVLQEELHDPVPGPYIDIRGSEDNGGRLDHRAATGLHPVFHYANVTYFLEHLQTGAPVISPTDSAAPAHPCVR